MSFRLSIFTTVTQPLKRGDNVHDALKCYSELADEVVIVDGCIPNIPGNDIIDIPKNAKIVRSIWPREFPWSFIGNQFQLGYNASESDRCVRMDIDTIVHQNDYQALRQALELYNDQPALSFYKKQLILPDRYNIKSRLVLAANKAKFGDRIHFDSGPDLCQMSLDSEYIQPGDAPEVGIGLWNYECILKTKPQILEDKGRFARAWQKHFGQYKLGGPDDESAYKEWLKMLTGRFNKPQEHISLDKHPAVIQKTIKNLTPDQWGYSGFGILGKNNYIN